ncbi:hypothetical protein BTVI_82185 [Pitangus sulphuratus]|nr:hypothetical protein BTVI_82185 [Pitangus sulphuratus]
MAEEAAGSEAAFCLQNVTITDDSKDDYQCEEVSADDEFSLQEEDEDLSKALQAIQEQAEDAQILTSQSVLTSEKSVCEIPEAMDDFFCNFLVRLGMSRTLDCFQTEWYELIERGVLTVKDAGLVPTVYTHNQQLQAENISLKKDLENYKLAASKTKEALLKMQKERDFHRMHHKRVVQEKNRLICDMKRLKAHYASYEPVLKQLSEKYETTLKQKMLTSLERDKAVGQVTGLQAVLENLESGCVKQISEAKDIRNAVLRNKQCLDTGEVFASFFSKVVSLEGTGAVAVADLGSWLGCGTPGVLSLAKGHCEWLYLALGLLNWEVLHIQSKKAGERLFTRTVHDCTRKKEFEGPTQKALREARQQKIVVAASSPYDPVKDAEKMGKRDLKDSEFPDDTEVNTYLECAKEHTQPLKSEEYQLSNILKVHDLAVSW